MFGRRKLEFVVPHAPLPRSQPAAQAEPPLPRRCPLTQSACRDNCAWMVEGECAATYLAREVYTLVEVLARPQRSLALPLGESDPSPTARSLALPLGVGDPSPNRSPATPASADGGLPPNAVVLPQKE